MPGELLGLAVAVTFKMGANVVLMVVGTGERRSAVMIRAAFHLLMAFVWAAIAALILWIIVADFDILCLVLLPIFLACAYISGKAAADEIHDLRHWGEPKIVASNDGLLIVRQQRLLPWLDIRQVKALRRGVRIEMENGKPVRIATREPMELAEAISAHLPEKA